MMSGMMTSTVMLSKKFDDDVLANVEDDLGDANND